MPCCAIITCKTRSQDLSVARGGISFHRFPHDPDTASKWIEATGRKTWFPTKHSTICSAHFVDSDFNESTKTRRLFPQAHPTIDIWNPPYIKPVEAITSQSGILDDEVDIKDEPIDESDNMIIEISLKDGDASAVQDEDKNKKNPVFSFDRLEYINKLKLQLTRAHKALKLKDLKVKNLQRKLRVRNKKIERLENTISELNNKLVSQDEAPQDLLATTTVLAPKVVRESFH